jgi:hypothetical protein
MDLFALREKIKLYNASQCAFFTLKVSTVQGMLDEIERLRDALDDAREGLLNERDFHENWDASKEHAAELIQREVQNRNDDLEALVGELVGVLDSNADLCEGWALCGVAQGTHALTERDRYTAIAESARAWAARARGEA